MARPCASTSAQTVRTRQKIDEIFVKIESGSNGIDIFLIMTWSERYCKFGKRYREKQQAYYSCTDCDVTVCMIAGRVTVIKLGVWPLKSTDGILRITHITSNVIIALELINFPIN